MLVNQQKSGVQHCLVQLVLPRPHRLEATDTEHRHRTGKSGALVLILTYTGYMIWASHSLSLAAWVSTGYLKPGPFGVNYFKARTWLVHLVSRTQYSAQ
jgi:hypothetical protein